MIKQTNNVDDIVLCWQEAFGDSREDILFFIKNARDYQCIAYYDKDKICSLLFLVDCKVKGKLARYIYAACTLNKCKNRGIMTRLFEYSQTICDNICLIPAEDWLIDYYIKRGFTERIELDDISFSQSREIIEYLFEGCNLAEPFALCCLGG